MRNHLGIEEGMTKCWRDSAKHWNLRVLADGSLKPTRHPSYALFTACRSHAEGKKS